jgi:hypothetical protein
VLVFWFNCVKFLVAEFSVAMKFLTFFYQQFWKISVGVWNIKKISLMAEKIGQVLRNSTKKNQLFISDGSRVINLLMKPCNLTFLQKRWHRSKTMTDKYWQKDVLNSKVNVEFGITGSAAILKIFYLILE